MSRPPSHHSQMLHHAWFRRICWLFSVACCLSVLASLAQADESPRMQPDVVYGHKDGLALTFDVIRPEKSNGAGILWLQSGG